MQATSKVSDQSQEMKLPGLTAGVSPHTEGAESLRSRNGIHPRPYIRGLLRRGIKSDSLSSDMMSPVKVGFDLDGVLFYNPLRFVRKPIELVKKHILHKDTKQFYVPKSKLEKFLWKIIHMSSLNPASGWEMIREMKENGLIEPYLITARFSCLENDFERCLERIEANKYFAGTFHNSQDEQPHLFKERMIKSLGIKFYVEDNWNIVDHLNKSTDVKVLWISNFMDNDIPCDERYSDLSGAIKRLTSLVGR